MVVDTSALVAIYGHEPGSRSLARLIDEAPAAALSVVTQVETVAVLCGSRFRVAPADAHDFIASLSLDLVPVTVEVMQAAVDGLLAYGKGRHPASLNLGDCFAYALAKVRAEPLLFVGDDFGRTDIMPAWQPSA